MNPEILLPQPIFFNAAIYASTALVYSLTLFIVDHVLTDREIFIKGSFYRNIFSYLSIFSWPILLFGALTVVAVRVGGNAHRSEKKREKIRDRRRKKRRKRRNRRNKLNRNSTSTNATTITYTQSQLSDIPDLNGLDSLSINSKSYNTIIPVGNNSRSAVSISSSTQNIDHNNDNNNDTNTSTVRRSSSAPPPSTKTNLVTYKNIPSTNPQYHLNRQSQSKLAPNQNNPTHSSPIITTPPPRKSSRKKRNQSDSTAIMTSSNSLLDNHLSTSTIKKIHSTTSGTSKKSNKSSSSIYDLVPRGYVSVTRNQKAFAAIGFIWIFIGLILTCAITVYVFLGQRKRLLSLATTLDVPTGSREWLIPIFTGIIFLPLFVILALHVSFKVYQTIRPTPQSMEIRTVSIGDDDDDDKMLSSSHSHNTTAMAMMNDSVFINNDDDLIADVESGIAPLQKERQLEFQRKQNTMKNMRNSSLITGDSGVFTDDYDTLLDDDDDDDDEDDDEDDEQGEEESNQTKWQGRGKNVGQNNNNNNNNNSNNNNNNSNDSNNDVSVDVSVYNHDSKNAGSSSHGWKELYKKGSNLPFQPDETTVERMMRQLRDMGFPNSHENIAALQASSFDLEKASDKLAVATTSS